MIAASPAIHFADLVQNFFCRRLIAERNVSTQTVSSYRDTFRLLLRYAEQHGRKLASALSVEDMDAPFIMGFLDHLEHARGNSVRSRNTRLAAIRSFMKYVSLQDPVYLPTTQRVLAIPSKRHDWPQMEFLSREEIEAILGAMDQSSWSGRRDHAMFTTFYNTGARVSEITGLTVSQVDLDHGPSVQLHGKGRKQRVVPLWRKTAKMIADWLSHIDKGPQTPVFPNRAGKTLSRSGVEHRLRMTVGAAVPQCPSLRDRRITPHTFRHTTAMHLLQSGVDITVIALWLGHESPVTTHMYVEADLAMKEQALAKIAEPSTRWTRYRPDDRLLAFLESL